LPLPRRPRACSRRAEHNSITAFRTLDSANRGFVTRAETDRIPGFTGFDNSDIDRDGHLTAEEFATAWKFYSGQ
jgi:Ca2+-binding EF-hand superfamily protein